MVSNAHLLPFTYKNCKLISHKALLDYAVHAVKL